MIFAPSKQSLSR